ncbi:MAG: TVP38/TMEM64 family protein [Microscillaceae bacterium]
MKKTASTSLSLIYSWAQKIVFYTWLALWVVLLLLFWQAPELFNKAHILAFVGQFSSHCLFLVYFLLCVGRGIFLLPSTPFILAGTVIFAQNLWLLFFLSLLAILISAGLIYKFSEHLGLKNYFEKHYARQITYIQEKINTPVGFWFLAGWSFFPLVPTDLMCYVAGTVRMRFAYFLGAVSLGEAPLVWLSIFWIAQIGQEWLGA